MTAACRRCNGLKAGQPALRFLVYRTYLERRRPLAAVGPAPVTAAPSGRWECQVKRPTKRTTTDAARDVWMACYTAAITGILAAQGDEPDSQWVVQKAADLADAAVAEARKHWPPRRPAHPS